MADKDLRAAAIRLYRDGYIEGEIIQHKERLMEVHPLGNAWANLKQSTLNRWIKLAREDDPDLEVWHVLSRRKWRPGVYTNWKPDGVVILGHHYDLLGDTHYLGPGDHLIPTGDKNIVRVVRKSASPSPGWKMPDSDAVGLYVAELSSLGYSLREIASLWKGGKTRHPDMDKAPRVQWLAGQLREVRAKPMSIATLGRILKIYSFQDRTTKLPDEGE